MYGLLRFVIASVLALLIYKQPFHQSKYIMLFLALLLVILTLMPLTHTFLIIDGFAPISSPNTDPIIDPLCKTGASGIYGIPAYG